MRVHAPAESIADRITGLLEAIDERSCMLTVAGDSLGVITVFLSMIDADFDVIEPPELVEHVARLADRYHRAAHPPAPGA